MTMGCVREMVNDNGMCKRRLITMVCVREMVNDNGMCKRND